MARGDRAEHDHSVVSEWRVPFDGSFRVDRARTRPPRGAPGKEGCREALAEAVARIARLQRVFHATDRHALLLVFQAMDAAGKDGTIRSVLSGVNPAGCQVYSFKAPSSEELDHDFLWRTTRCLPERGRIGIFNRSYYEEVLVVRVHPEHLARQRLPAHDDLGALWASRYDSIREHERHLARSGTVIAKFWLHVSKDEQRKRLIDRIDEPESNWKFEAGDVAERRHWDAYMDAYQDALNATSRPWAPWYAVPADDKAYLRLAVAEILLGTMEGLPLAYPEADGDQRERLRALREELERGA